MGEMKNIRCWRCGVLLLPADVVWLDVGPTGDTWHIPDTEKPRVREPVAFGSGCAAVVLANANGPRDTAGIGGCLALHGPAQGRDWEVAFRNVRRGDSVVMFRRAAYADDITERTVADSPAGLRALRADGWFVDERFAVLAGKRDTMAARADRGNVLAAMIESGTEPPEVSEGVVIDALLATVTWASAELASAARSLTARPDLLSARGRLERARKAIALSETILARYLK